MSEKTRVVRNKKTVIIAGSIIIVVLGLTITGFTLAHNNKDTDSSVVGEKKTDTPKYPTILPSGKSIESLNGWTRISPPENDPVYAYTDGISGISISVSEQPIPASFVDNLDSRVSDLAKKYNATTQISAGDTKVYIGTSAKGPQSVIFAKNDVLVLIKSQQKIADKEWIKYIESLK
jgi:hypothetical protein